MRSYLKINGADLPKQVGINSENGLRISDGREGHLSHGPYISLAVGDYIAAFFIRRQSPLHTGIVSMDVCAQQGAILLAKRDISATDILHEVASFVKLDFNIEQNMNDIEVRMLVPAGLLIEVRELVIYRRTAREWGVQ